MAIARVIRARLFGIIAARVVVSTLLHGSGVAIGLSNPDTFPAAPFAYLIALTFALSLGYLATMQRALRAPWLVDLQFALDTLLVSAFIHVTGGITSHFSFLYVLPIIAASTLRARRGALQVAGLSATFYVGLVTAQYLDVPLTPVLDWRPAVVVLPPAAFARYTVAINLGGMFAVALLAGSLAERLRSARAGLEDASYEIADLRAFNDHVIDCLTAGLITTDAGYRILTFNRAAVRITGVTAGAAIGRDVRDLLRAGDEARTLFAPGPAGGHRLELPYDAPGGRTLELGLTVSTLQFPEGTTGFLVVFQDITQLKRLERESRLQQRLLAVGEMAAGIAHEIRNPLASMAGSIEVLRAELPLSAEQSELMDIVLRESARLNERIRLFLSYANPPRQSVCRLDARTVLRDTAAALQNSVDLRADHVIAVDAPDQPLWYEGDPTELRQVLWSLGTNALRAMPQGGALRMAVRADARPAGDGDLVFSVRDEGCGIPSHELERIFQPFHGAFRSGAGLGLSIVHRIVTDYGGRMEVASTEGTGTAVDVRLPFDRPVLPAVPEGKTA